MKITVNRIPEEHPEESLTVRQILSRKGWSFPLLIVRVDGALVERTDYETALVRDGADVELCHLVSGG
jgi:sulfur carrier protein